MQGITRAGAWASFGVNSSGAAARAWASARSASVVAAASRFACIVARPLP
jgi:hypothetical protein